MLSGALAILKSEAQRNEMSIFYEKNKDRFFSMALKILQNNERSEDAVQDAFLIIADKPDTFFSLNDTKRIRYLCEIVKNVSLGMLSKSRKIPTENLSEDIIYQNDENPVENLLFDKISRDEILAFIDTLPETQRSVLVLSYSSELSADEISRTLDISISVVYKRLYFARKSIKKFIAERSRNNV